MAQHEQKIAKALQKELGCDYTTALMAVRKFISTRIAGGAMRGHAILTAQVAMRNKSSDLLGLARTSAAVQS